MGNPKSVSPYFCLPIIDDLVADPAATQKAAAYRLPAGFPADLLSEDQLEACEEWFDTWAAELMHSVRLALLGKDAPADLAHLTRHAVVLAHLLRLHPAAEGSLTELARSMGVSRRTLFYAQEEVMAHIRPAVAATMAHKQNGARFRAQLGSLGTLNVAAASQPDARFVLVPFKPHVHCAHRFATVRQVASLPVVASVREELTPNGKNAILIKLK